MHAVKVTWVGQTFALANCSDSGGKKSRIRRSKEERKSMVESFIKKYQNSNDGNFPSLNLTHKEVGGSFYTVREIVREIIQENRVLGPAKFTSDEQNNDQLFDQYPLGSISTQPPSDLCLSLNETQFVSNDHHSAGVDLVSTLSGQVNGKQQQMFNNEILVDKEYNETDANKSSPHVNDEMQYTDVEISHKLEAKLERVEEIVQAPTSKVTPIATDVIVETFPLKSPAKPTQGSDGRSDDAKDLTRTLEEYEAKKVEASSATGKTGPMLDRMDFVELEKQSSGSINQKSAGNLVDPLAESLSCCTTEKSVTTSILEDTDLQIDASSTDVSSLQTAHQNQVVAGVEPKIVPNETYTQNSNAKKTSTSGESLSQGENVETKADIQDIQSTEEVKNSTLNRINLESWEGASRKPEKTEANPAWAAVKAFITAFVRFWTE
ncbi:hypothetical protein BVC80_9057g43 [Macleaya cordata]|uniref:AT3G52170-like helix-turn-helix domain-containing protein n=1 Tax=Macleaya cordata TaxID=56857 RepID=A0A200R9R1_MACCD|nr:hypothetical protein BVC80_9057g43 [Macleaya cordata]